MAVSRLRERRPNDSASTSAVVRPTYPGVIPTGAVISRDRAVSRRLGVRSWTAALASLVFGSAVVRILVAQRHTSPRYWPDEYIYAAISHSLAHGHLQVRDQPARFYAILQPLVAAPLWSFFPTVEAYRLIQVENAVAASLVVVPIWMLGRELGLARSGRYLACVYALLVPTLVMIPITISDFIAYPLAMGGVATAVRSLNHPSRGRQLAFLCFAMLATLARVEYFVLVPAYLVGAVMLERRRAHRVHPIVFLALLPGLAGAVLGVTGYYSVGLGSFRWSMATWMGLQAFLLALTAGIVIVPGAVAAIVRPSGRAEKAFASVTAVFTLLIFLQASVLGASEDRYKERYLFAVAPLLALAFLIYLRGRRPHRLIVLLVAASLILTAAREPLSGFTFRAPFYDSQTLITAWLLQRHLGASTSSLLLAIVITAGALFAIAASFRQRIGVAALPIAAALLLGVTVVAVHVDTVNNIKRGDATWVDDAVAGAHVTAVATPSSPRLKLIKQLYWNSSINREVALENATPSDTYPTKQVKPGVDGTLPGIHGYFLFDRTGTQAIFTGTRLKATNGDFGLYEGAAPRFRLLVENLLSTAWLSPYSRLRAWPDGDGDRSPVVRFTLSLPPVGDRQVHIQLGSQLVVVGTKSPLRITCRQPHWPFKLIMASRDAVPDSAGRPVSVGMTNISVGHSSAHVGAPGCTASPA
jgi:hypothetical protein